MVNNVVCLLNDELSELTKNDGALRNGHFHTMYWCLFFKISRNTDVIVVISFFKKLLGKITLKCNDNYVNVNLCDSIIL